jgi:hypothetical protein
MTRHLSDRELDEISAAPEKVIPPFFDLILVSGIIAYPSNPIEGLNTK